MKKESILLIVFVLLLFFTNYSFLDKALIKAFDNHEVGVVSRIIDGDTIEVRFLTGTEEKTNIRLLGINSPERGESGYGEALKFLEDKILEREVQIYFEGSRKDRYGRTLGYVFLGGTNVNLESVRSGYSGFYFPSGRTKYYNEFVSAWDECIDKNIGICKKSELLVASHLSPVSKNIHDCVALKDWNIKLQIVEIKNICNEGLNLTGWSVKDEGRKKFVFGEEILAPGKVIKLKKEDFGEDYVWTKSGDSIFIRDKNDKLIIFETY